MKKIVITFYIILTLLNLLTVFVNIETWEYRFSGFSLFAFVLILIVTLQYIWKNFNK
jgi:hypothetical protein